MISIYGGRSFDDGDPEVFCKIEARFREHLHVFSRNPYALAVFICISLHVNEHGWAWPGRALIKHETGIATDDALSVALADLRQIKIADRRIFAHYRQWFPRTARWGRSAYLIFPDVDHGPPPFDHMTLFDPAIAPETAVFMYCVHVPGRGHRIGATTRLVYRMRKLRTAHQGFRMVAWYQSATGSHEAAWYELFSRKHRRGSWYNLNQRQIRQFVRYALAAGGSADPVRGKRIKLSAKTPLKPPTEVDLDTAGPDMVVLLDPHPAGPDMGLPDAEGPDHKVEPSKEEVPREAEKDTGPNGPATSETPAPEPTGFIASLSDLEGDPAGPLILAAKVEKARQAAGGQVWTVPPEAGGTDSLGEAMVTAWAEAKKVTYIPPKLRQGFAAALAKMARQSGFMQAENEGDPVLTEEQAAQAVLTALDPDGEWEFHNRKGVFCNPHVEGFKRAWNEVALRLVQKGSGDNDGAVEGKMAGDSRWQFDAG